MVLDSDLYYWAEFLYFLLCFALFLWWFLIYILHDLKIQTNIYTYILIWVTIGPEVAGPMEPDGGGFEVKKTRLLKGAISGFGVRLVGQVRA